MASESRARDGGHDDDRGAGGKILRDRRPFPTAAASPYSRPVETASPPASPPRPRRWFSGIVSGAGRLISSVFRSEDDVSLCSSSETSENQLDGDSDVADDAGDDINGEERENEEAHPSTNLQLIEDPRGDCQPLASISGSKLAIERLLQQETFTRYEGSRLIEIIRSRITDSPRVEDRLGTRLLEFPAVIEAKKWVEQKRSDSTSKVDLSFQRCALNTNVLHHDDEYDKESPINMAKSYMQSLPAWESPLARSSGSKPAFELYESPYRYNSSAPSVMPMKRSSFAEQTRNVRQKTTSEEFSKNFSPYGDLQTSITGEGSPEWPPQDSRLSPGKDSSDPVAIASPGVSSMKEKSFPSVLGVADVHAKVVNFPVDNGYCNETDNTFYKDAISTPEESLGASRRDEPLTVESRSPVADKEIPIANEQHLESEIIHSTEHGSSVVPDKTGMFNTSFIKNKGLEDNFTDAAEPIVIEPEDLNMGFSSPVQSSVPEKKSEAKSLQSGRFDHEEAAGADGRSHEGNEETQSEASPPVHFTSNGDSYPSSSAGSGKVNLATQAFNLSSHTSIGASNGDLDTAVIDIHKLSPKAAIKRKYVRAKRVHKVHDETTKKGIKEIPQEAPTTGSPGSTRARRRSRGPSTEKQVVKQVVLRPRKSRAVKQ